tara:strand:- start:421 stop:570 length:150 start_codon:yes stop_codon:yes gene_type:complete
MHQASLFEAKQFKAVPLLADGRKALSQPQRGLLEKSLLNRSRRFSLQNF